MARGTPSRGSPHTRTYHVHHVLLRQTETNIGSTAIVPGRLLSSKVEHVGTYLARYNGPASIHASPVLLFEVAKSLDFSRSEWGIRFVTATYMRFSHAQLGDDLSWLVHIWEDILEWPAWLHGPYLEYEVEQKEALQMKNHCNSRRPRPTFGLECASSVLPTGPCYWLFFTSIPSQRVFISWSGAPQASCCHNVVVFDSWVSSCCVHLVTSMDSNVRMGTRGKF